MTFFVWVGCTCDWQELVIFWW